MPAPTYVDSVTGASGTSNSPSVAVPTGVAINDIAVVSIYAETDTLTVTAVPTGFTSAVNSPIRTSNGTNEQTQWIYWKRLTAADTGSYTFTFSGSVFWRAMSVAYRGCATSGDPWNVSNSAARSSAAAATPAVTVTTTVVDTKLVWASTSWSSGPWTPPSGFTEREDTSSEMTMADRDWATATSTGSVSGTGPSNWMTAWLGALIQPQGTTHAGAVALSSSSTLTVGGTVIPVQQGAAALTVSSTLTANAGQQGNVALTVNKTLTVAGNITLQQAAISLVASSTLVFGITGGGLYPGTTTYPGTNTYPNGSLIQAPQQTHTVVTLLNVVATLEATGSRSRAAILETRYERPPIQHPFRVIVQEILTGEIVEWDLPVSEDFTYTRQLTGPTVMEGEFKPEIISVQELGLDGFAYFFHVEIGNEIRASAIFLPPKYEGSSLKFSAEGVAAAPHFVTWTSTLSSINIDPFVVVRNIWNHVQADPRSNYGVVVSNNLSGRRLGEAASTVTETDSQGQSVTRDIPAEPYELMWWEAPNCGEQIDTLADQTPFDYKERVTWNADKTDVLHYIDLSYPRAGSPKPDLAFNEENILEVVPVQEPEDSYASEVIVIGAGEGTATIRGYAGEHFANRVKKSYVVTDKSITTKARADAVAKSELGLRRGRLFEISEIVIRAIHANASIGEYDLGDDIYVEVDIPWMLSTYGAWYRIISINHQPSYDYLRLGLERSDSFRYPTTTQV